MQTPRQTRSSVLGKRSHRSELSSSNVCEQLATPDPSPTLKRAKTTTTELDGDHNKENIPPLVIEAVNVQSARAQRALRRAATEVDMTPTRRRSTSARRASTSSLVEPGSPVAAVEQLSIVTPPSTPQPRIPIHARARALLRATCDSAVDMPGRVDERKTINNFITSFLDDSSDDISTLYISGTPGTGKTALVNSIIRDLHSNEVKIFTVNCMALNNLDALWERLSDEFASAKKRKVAGRATKSVKGKEAVQGLLNDLSVKCILILDELDHITPDIQALTSLFSLPVSNPSSIRVIGIANTHTLTSTAASFSSSVKTLHFAPYTPSQLLEIIHTRLSPLNEEEGRDVISPLFPAQSLSFLTKKVAALTGDVRSLFEVLRGAIEAAVATCAKGNSQPSVAISHILSAVKAHMPASTKSAGASNSETMNKVKVLGLHARIVLACVLLSSRRSDAGLPLSSSCPPSPVKRGVKTNVAPVNSGVEISSLHGYYMTVLGHDDNSMFSAVSRSEFSDLVNMLEGVGLLSMTSASASSPTKGVKRAFSRTSSFTSASNKAAEVKLCEGLMTEEVLKGLGIRELAARASEDIMEEEVSSIWYREISRISKEVKIVESKASKERREESFGSAMED